VLCRTSFRYLAAVGLAAATTGCGAATPSIRSHHPGPPTEGEARDAYFNTPLVIDAVVRELPLGTPQRAIYRRFEVPAIRYERNGRLCGIYPIEKTERWDAFGSPEASEWELCFSRARLVSKRRLP
jgi:hypothetical protein